MSLRIHIKHMPKCRWIKWNHLIMFRVMIRIHDYMRGGFTVVQSRFSLKLMRSRSDIQSWSLSTGSSIANEVVNSVLMSGFTVATSEVKPSSIFSPSVVVLKVRKGNRRSAFKANLTVTPKRQGGKTIQISCFKTCEPH